MAHNTVYLLEWKENNQAIVSWVWNFARNFKRMSDDLKSSPRITLLSLYSQKLVVRLAVLNVLKPLMVYAKEIAIFVFTQNETFSEFGF